MKYKFVLDENVFYHAVNLVDENNKKDASARELICLIAKNCHRIVVDIKINKVFVEILKELKKPGRGDSDFEKFIMVLKKIRGNDQKYLFVKYEATGLNFEKDIQDIPEKDTFVVKLALNEKVKFVVTADNDLSKAINNNKFLKSEKIIALQTKNAKEKAKES